MGSHAEYLDRVRELREAAEQMLDPRVRDDLIRAAEAYERMAGRENKLKIRRTSGSEKM